MTTFCSTIGMPAPFSQSSWEKLSHYLSIAITFALDDQLQLVAKNL